jgi:hypothetical protein
VAGEIPEQHPGGGFGSAVSDSAVAPLVAALAERYAVSTLLGRGSAAAVYLA